ncbi:hypothetical protein DOT_5056 [Desulfosporosinus sp. OT]|nr:hypothetical protein DOT_5056 [Desulfosporosinus sp. OT]
MPKIIAKDVITMGRNLTSPASTKALFISTPSLLLCLT